jgi:ribosomal protein L36
MKVKSSIRRMCGFCQIIRRGKILFVRCQRNNRHKQRQGFHTLNQKFKIGDLNFCECSGENNTNINNVNKQDNKEEHKCDNDIIESMKNKLI